MKVSWEDEISNWMEKKTFMFQTTNQKTHLSIFLSISLSIIHELWTNWVILQCGAIFLELLWSPAVTMVKNPWHPGIPAIQPNDLLHLSWHILDVNKKWRLVMERRPVIQYSDISYNSCHKLWPWQSVITGDFYRIKNINHKCGCKYL